LLELYVLTPRRD
jgi:hypothetical protein